MGGDKPMTWEIFAQFLENPQMIEYFRNIDVDISEARGLFLLLDMNGSGTLNTEEFLNGCIRLRGFSKSLDLALLTRQVKLMYEKQMVHYRSIEDQIRMLSFSSHVDDISAFDMATVSC